MKYDRCDFSLYGYYIHDVIWEDKKLVLFCTYAEREHMVSFAKVTHIEERDLLCGSTIKYLTVAKKRDCIWYKILCIEPNKCIMLCADGFTNE